MVNKKITSEAFTAKSKSSGRVVNFGSKESRDNAIKSGEYEEDKPDTSKPAPQKPKVNIFDKPKVEPQTPTKIQSPKVSASQVKSELPKADTKTFNEPSDINKIPDIQKREISMKIDELDKLTRDAKEKGEKAPNFNLCQITVPGTNLYCEGNAGIPREQMPQFKGKPTPGSPADKLPKDKSGEVDTEPMFKQMLKDKGIKTIETEVPSDRLKATQSELVGSKVAGMTKALEEDPNHPKITAPIYVSRDGYVIDGHHRWAAVTSAAIKDGKPANMKVIVVDMDIKDAIPMCNKFAEEQGVAAKKADANKEGPSDSKGVISKIKEKISKWSNKEKEFFKKHVGKAGSDERRSWKEAITDKAKGAIAAIKKGAKHEVEEFKTAGEAVKDLFNGKEINEDKKKALKKVAIKVATTALFGAVGGGLAQGLAGFGKHVAMEFIPHVVGETILTGVGRAAMFAGDEDDDVYMERFIKLIADKIENEKISAELMNKMIDSYNSKKENGINEYHTKTPHERVTAFNDRIKRAADKLKDVESPMEKKMLQNKIKLAKFGLQNYKQQQSLKDKAERERKAAKMKTEEVAQLTNDQSEMVKGIIDILLQVKDIDNRMEMAKKQIQNFKDEDINFNYSWFLSACGLDNSDEPVNIATYTPTATHINPVSVNSNMKRTEMREAQQKLVYNSNPDAVEVFLKKYPKVKQVMGVFASKNTDLLKGYKAFLKFKDKQEGYLGGRAEVTASPTFGSKVFYKYEFGGVKNHWPEIYQYVHFQQNESINEVEYKDAVDKFNADLMKNSQVQRIAQFHKRSVKDVVKALQPYLKVLRYSDKSVKVISIDFRDTNSDIKVHVSQTYKQNENWDSEMEPVKDKKD